jgi:hypothetical protein
MKVMKETDSGIFRTLDFLEEDSGQKQEGTELSCV